MSKTLSFVKLDFITVKPYMTIKALLVILAVGIYISIGTGQSLMMIGMLMMYGTIYTSYPFMVGDKNGIDTLYATLSINRRQIVGGRYIFALCLNAFCGFGCFLLSGVVAMIQKNLFVVTETITVIGICFIIFSIVEAFQLPIFFKLGYSKAKFLAYIPLFGWSGIVAGASALVGKENLYTVIDVVTTWVGNNTVLAGLMFFGVWLCIMLGSCELSYRFYGKRDF